jgi:hypothetical protein
VKRTNPTDLIAFLGAERRAIGEAWLEQALAEYGSEYGHFARQNADPFANPVGAILRHGLEALFEALLEDAGAERYHAALEPIVRIKAVQEAPPSEALAFVPMLKSVIRTRMAGRTAPAIFGGALERFDARIDRVALLAFDIYAECRERLFRVRINELQRRTAGLLRFHERAGGRSRRAEEQPRIAHD